MTLLTWDQIFGQDVAVNWLRKSLAADRLPHGLIFAGPAGVGKGTTATVLAATFLCERTLDASPCGECESCRAISAGVHPDFHVLSKEMVRLYDKTGKSKAIDFSMHVILPELVVPAGKKSNRGRGKVFVVEQAHLLNTAAQNAMLKTLEEPAGRTLIILLSDENDALLPTIRSRCQIVRFGPLRRDVIERFLADRSIDQPTATSAALLADGSLGLALRWIEDGVVQQAGELAGLLPKWLGGRETEELPGWFKRAAEAYADRQIERDPLASKDAATRDGLAIFLRVAADSIRHLLTETDDPAVQEHLCGAIEAIVQAEGHLDANVNVSLAFGQLSVEFESAASSA